MSIYIALLRGINVGGRNKILMSDLKTLFAEMGFTNIHTYIQSGNIVFESGASNPDKLQNLIEERIYRQYGFLVPVLIREGKERL